MRKHRILIDQSGKVEQNNTDTAIAYSTSNSSDLAARCIRIKKSDKVSVKTEAKNIVDSNKKINLKMFSAGVYMLTKPVLSQFSEIIIDKEYEGNGGLIKTHLNNFYTDYSDYSTNTVPDIKFGRVHEIGNGNPECHELANKVRAGKLEPHFQPNHSYLKNLMLPNRS